MNFENRIDSLNIKMLLVAKMTENAIFLLTPHKSFDHFQFYKEFEVTCFKVPRVTREHLHAHALFRV
jgi:hypothetical protein